MKMLDQLQPGRDDLTPRPEDFQSFRMAQLLLVLAAARATGALLDLERLAIAEFLSANPFLVFADNPDKAEDLQLLGFGRHSIAYASPGQRFASRRTRVLADVAQLVALGLCQIAAHDGRRVVDCKRAGIHAAAQLTSVYADAYRQSAQMIIPIVAKATDAGLHKRLREWLRADAVLFDLLDIGDATEFVEASNQLWTETL